MDTFGKRLKHLRNIKNKQQKEAAIELNISKSTYSAYENDIRMPGLKTLIQIADYYNVSLDYLIGRDNKFQIDKSLIENHINNIKNNIVSLENYIKSCK